jgi:hypothetical protein
VAVGRLGSVCYRLWWLEGYVSKFVATKTLLERVIRAR